MLLLLSTLVSLMSGTQKGKRRKIWESKEKCFKFPEVTLAERDGACSNAERWTTMPPILLWLEAAMSNRTTDPWYLKNGVPFFFFPSWLPQGMCASCSRNMCITAYHGSKVWKVDRCCCARSWNWLDLSVLTTIYCPSLSLEVTNLQ